MNSFVSFICILCQQDQNYHSVVYDVGVNCIPREVFFFLGINASLHPLTSLEEKLFNRWNVTSLGHIQLNVTSTHLFIYSFSIKNNPFIKKDESKRFFLDKKDESKR